MLSSSLAFAASGEKPCPQVSIVDAKPNFTRSEKLLLCGDPHVYEWREIPAPQVRYHLKTFLLDRGYYQPEIQDDNGKFTVRAGPRARLRQLDIVNLPVELPRMSQGIYIRRGLTPRLLNELESAVRKHLSMNGYPCNTLSIKAVPTEGRVIVDVVAGRRENFPVLLRQKNESFDLRTLERFEAFRVGIPYNSMLVELSERRIRNSGLVQDLAYLPQCHSGPFELEQRVFMGKPKFMSLGAGFDTEQFLIGRARFRVQRLNSHGSLLQSQIMGSAKMQSFSNVLDVHMWPPQARDLLYVGLEGIREDERSHESIAATLRFGFGKSIEGKDYLLEGRAGPTFERLWIFRGPGLANSKLLGAEGSLFLTSHLFEYFSSSPRKGHKLGLEARGTASEVSSTFSVLNLTLSSQNMFLIDENFVSDLILGLRGFVSTSFRPASASEAARIPARYRFFLGGSGNLRGFGREELPKDGLGAFTAAYLGAELRLARIFLLEPILFLDMGALGNETFQFRPPYYTAPGFGFRYQSPVGTLRTSLAYGLTVGGGAAQEQSRHVQFFLSFGEEF